jgi:hypothetical protein
MVAANFRGVWDSSNTCARLVSMVVACDGLSDWSQEYWKLGALSTEE